MIHCRRFLPSIRCSLTAARALAFGFALASFSSAWMIAADERARGQADQGGAPADYFGADAPTETATIFAPGIVSRVDRFEARIAFSRDLRECYLTETDATFSRPRLLWAQRGATGWTEFSAVPFGVKFKVCHEPFVSDDNQHLYFTADGDEAVPSNRRDFWVVERQASGWGEPSRLPEPINSSAVEFFLSQSSDGTVVFASNRPGGLGDFDLYSVEKSADGILSAVNFGPSVNTPGPEYDPCLSRDGKFLVFASARAGRRDLDLYVSFRQNDKTWTTPVALTGDVNTDANEYAPSLSPDGRCLFFIRHDGKQSDVYWITTAQFSRNRPSAK